MTHLDWDWRSAAIGAWQQRLSLHNTYVRFDCRGTGLSQRVVPIIDIDQQIDDFKAVVDSEGLERFAIHGASGGGPVAIGFAARYPKRVSHLVLSGSGARGIRARGAQSMPLETYEAVNTLLLQGWGSEHDTFRQILTSALFPNATVEQTRSFNHMQRVSASPDTAVKIHSMIAHFDVSQELSQVRCPTLIMHSVKDQRWPIQEMQLVASGIQHSEVRLQDTSNHLPLSHEPAFEAAHQWIDQFLGVPTNGPRP
jgi:pimeloyl-ACP methyl ester carboxylesterase